MMAAADKLVELMYSWIEQKERSAKKLHKLADELEALRDNCNKWEVAGSTMAVVGCASIIAGGVVFFTGGLAAPVLAGVGGVYSGLGATLSIGAKIAEHFSSSSTLKEAKEIEEDCNEKEKRLQQLFEELKAQSPFTDPDQNDQYVVKMVMASMARRSGLPDFDPSFLLDDCDFKFGGQGTSRRPNPMLMPAFIGVFGVLCAFSFQPSGKKLNLLLSTGSKKLIQKLSIIGFKTVVKAGLLVVGGAVGLVFSLPEMVESWEKLIKENHVTEASESLRETARKLLEATQEMKSQLNEMKKSFDRLKKVKLCIENRERTQDEKKTLIKFAIDLCHDEEVKQWLRKNYNSEAFFYFVDIVNLLEKEIKKNSEEKKKKKKKTPEDEIHIVFVAHGAITEALIPSSCLLPFRNIKDVLLYSPWNCAINSYTAYGIASGRILPQHRVFYCRDEKCPIPHSGHKPTPLPNDWNRMKNARGGLIPNIMVSPVGYDGDKAWESFMFLKDRYGHQDWKRVVIPFKLPGNMRVVLPFYVVILAVSIVLFFTNLKATIHLAACLSKRKGTQLDEDSLKNQYSYTIDKTSMSCLKDVFPIEDQRLYQLLREVFD